MLPLLSVGHSPSLSEFSFGNAQGYFHVVLCSSGATKKKSTISFLVFKRSPRLTESLTGWWDKIKLWELAMLILVPFLSSWNTILFFPKKTAPTLPQWDKICEEAEWWEDFQQPLSFFSPKHLWMWHLGTQFRCEHGGSAVLTVRLNGLFQS